MGTKGAAGVTREGGTLVAGASCSEASLLRNLYTLVQKGSTVSRRFKPAPGI